MKTMKCPLCGKNANSFVYCYKEKQSICWNHCKDCQYFISIDYSCSYKLSLVQKKLIELQDRRRKANKERRVNEYAVNEHKAVMMRRDAIPKEVEHTSSHYDAAGVLKAKKAKKKKKVQMAAQQVATTVEEVSLF